MSDTSLQLIDIGVNLTSKRLRFDLAEIMDEAAKVGVFQMIITGTSIHHSALAIELCQQFPGKLFSTAGVHPHDAKDWNDASKSEIISMIANDCVKAIGETGLDFNRMFSPREKQIDVFQQQLEIACESDLPVFLHQRDAFDTFISVVKEYRHRLGNVVVHCFTDDSRALHALLDLDCHIGITGWICDERRGQELQSLVGDIPSSRLMLETDAPYLLPRNLEPKPENNTNLPKYLPHILHSVAHHQQRNAQQLAADVLRTTQQFFAI